LNGYVNFGYFHCKLLPDRWQPLHNTHIDGGPLSLAGYSVAISQAGTLLAMGEPEQSRVKIFDKDGSLWILRTTLEGEPDSKFGVSVDIAGGPVHWRNNPNFRAPLVLGVGVAKKGEPFKVIIYSCEKQCQQVDQLDNVHGHEGPQAYDIANNARIVAFGLANPASVEVRELSGDYYKGNRTLRPFSGPVDDPNPADAMWAVRLSETGDKLLVAEELDESPRKTVVRVYDWDGESYISRHDILTETEGELRQRQLAISNDGKVVAVGVSHCPNLDIEVFVFDAEAGGWIPRLSPPMPTETCADGTFLAWNVILDRDGRMLFAGAYPESDLIIAWEWKEDGWTQVGEPLASHVPGSHSSLAVSANGAHVVVGLPYAGLNEAGVVSTYSLPYSHCPFNQSHHFRLSLTTDYEPENLLWSLEDVKSKEILRTEGPFEFSAATLVEEICLDRSICHAFTIYKTAGTHGLQRPGRYDLFLDGNDLDRTSFSGRAKRVFFGADCLTCPEGTRMLRMMVNTCQEAQWKLVDDVGNNVVGGQATTDNPCSDPRDVEYYYWEETCIDESKCYEFTVRNTSPADQENPGLEYLLLYDNDIEIAYVQNVTTRSSSGAGNCP